MTEEKLSMLYNTAYGWYPDEDFWYTWDMATDSEKAAIVKGLQNE